MTYTIKPQFLICAIALSVVIAGCSSGDSSTDAGTDTGTETETDTDTPAGDIDISYAIFSERDADCATYDNSYVSSVTDETLGLGFEGAVLISSDSSNCTITANNIPNHDFNDATASFAVPVEEIDTSFVVSRSPAFAATSTALTQQTYNGVMLNGVVLDVLSAGCYKPNAASANEDGNVKGGCNINSDWLLDPMYTASIFGEDMHNAHTQADGLYHYHGNPNAMFDENPGPAGSPVIGFAADSFPIYGSYFLDQSTGSVRKAVSGYELIAGSRGTESDTNPGGSFDGTYVDDWEFTGVGDLDECNGMTVDGQYGYYVSTSYPWVINCFSGTPDSSFGK